MNQLDGAKEETSWLLALRGLNDTVTAERSPLPASTAVAVREEPEVDGVGHTVHLWLDR